MSGQIEVLVAIAGGGKSSTLRQLYVADLLARQRDMEFGRTLWLTPNLRDARETTRALCQYANGVLFAPRVLTFSEFADQILERTESPVLPLNPGQLRTVLRQIIDEMNRANQLQHFRTIASSTGFLDLVQSFIAELKRAETWPADFTAACKKRGAGARDLELAAIYERYQATLLEHRWFDAEGRFWWARESLGNGDWGVFKQLELVVVDGFDDFNQTQYRILGMLAERASRMLVSLPGETGEPRPELFAKSNAVAEELARHATVIPFRCPTTISNSSQQTESLPIKPIALQKIASDLFRNPRMIVRSSSCDGLEMVAIAGQRGEVQWIASRIKQLLLAGTPPQDIVVTFRDVADCADLIQQEFPAAGIPLELAWNPPLSEAPILRAVFKLLDLELSQWEFELVHDVLRSPLISIANDQDVSTTLSALRRLQLGENRELILDALARDERSAKKPAARTESAIAREVLIRLDEWLSNLRQSVSLTQWGVVLRDLAAVFKLDSAQGAHESDCTAWNRALEALFTSGQVDAQVSNTERKLGLAELRRVAADLWRQQELPGPPRARAGVRILPIAEIRNLDIPWLFVAGLNEQSFPRKRSDDCLYGELDRRVLNDQGLALGHHALRTQEEMLLFYRVLTRATKGLILTYPAVSSDGVPLSPSPYLGAVRELFESHQQLQQLEEQLDPIPRAGRVLTLSDLRVRGMHDALEGRVGLLSLASSLPQVQDSIRHSLRAVDLNHLRFHELGFGSGDGRLSFASNRNWLEDRFPRDRQFSATHLELFGQCPFRFFIERVLSIEPLIEIEYATDHGERGQLIHRVLSRLHNERLVNGEPTATIPEGAELAVRFEAILREVVASMPESDPMHAVMTELEVDNLVEWGIEYGRQWDAHIGQCKAVFSEIPQPVVFETAFGEVSPNADDDDGFGVNQPDTAPAVSVGVPGREVYLTGRVDRVDVGVVEGNRVFVIVDYKSGGKKSLNREHIDQGRNLQLPVYALAVSQAMLVDADSRPAQAAFWYLKDGGFTPGLKSKERGSSKKGLQLLSSSDWEDAMTRLHATVPAIVDSMRNGDFPVFNHDKDCTQHCPSRLVCRVAQVRAAADKLQKTWSIVPPRVG